MLPKRYPSGKRRGGPEPRSGEEARLAGNCGALFLLGTKGGCLPPSEDVFLMTFFC